MVMGEFSTGKSTFINALVGQSIAKVDAKPTTAVITKLSYGVEDRITVHFRDDSIQNYDTDSFAQLTAEGDDAANELHDGIAYVERELPIDILKSMSIIDSPGLNSIKAAHEETTRRFMDKADTVLWIFDANKPGSQTEIDALKRLNPRLEPICIVNKIDVVDEDDGDSPEKIMEDIGRKLSNNKLEYQKIIGISAKMAFQGKQKNNEKLIAESNIDEFYDAVDTMILPNQEQYKRNSMLDGLAKVIFLVSTKMNEQREENNQRKSSDYAAYIETETALASSLDELENIADVIMTEVESTQSTRRKRLNASEKTFYGVLHWLGLFVEKDNEMSVGYLEEAAVRSDNVAQNILVEVCSYLGQNDKVTYWKKRLGIKDKVTTKSKQGSFLLYVEAYFNIKNRGPVLTGTVSSGSLKENDILDLISEDDKIQKVKVVAIEMERKLFSSANEGDNIGILIAGVSFQELNNRSYSLLASKKSIGSFRHGMNLLSKSNHLSGNAMNKLGLLSTKNSEAF